MSKRDYYEVLGVSKNATKDEIKKAYRKLAMQYHPDRNQGDKGAEDKFKEVGEAYAVLNDDKKRAQYNRFGHAGAQNAGRYGGGGFNFSEGFDPMDIFASVFGNFGGFGDFGDDIFGRSRGGGASRQRINRGRDLSVTLKLTLEEIAKGVEKKVKVKYMGTCDTCKGSGSKDGKTQTCSRCNGSGEVRQISESLFGRVVNITTCNACGGEGVTVTSPCPACGGSGLERKEKVVKVGVPAGVTSGNFIRMRGEGNLGKRGGIAGDIIVGFQETSHKHFTRHGDDILYELLISYSQAVLGTSVEVPTLSGKVKLNIPAGTESGKLFRLKSKGIPHLNSVGNGDQLVRITIHVPKKVNSTAKRLLEELDEEITVDSRDNESFFEKVKNAFT